MRARRPEVDLGVVCEGTLQTGVVLRHRLRDFTGIEQGCGQDHLVVCGGRQVERLPGCTQVAARVDGFLQNRAGLARPLLQARIGQEHDGEIHHAAQQRKHEQDEQPIQFAARADRVDGEKNGDEDMQSHSQKRHADPDDKK
jgi:hypothetical protein